MNRAIIVTKNYNNGKILTAPSVNITKWSIETRIKITAGHLLSRLNKHKFSWRLYEDGALKEFDYYPIMTADRCIIYKRGTNEIMYAIVPALINLHMLEAVDSNVERKNK